MKRVKLKVKNDLNEIISYYFCEVPDEILKDFISVTRTKPSEFRLYLDKWAFSDWKQHFDLKTVDSVDQLRMLIMYSSRGMYPELYSFPELKPRQSFWVDYWVTSHMKYETELQR